MKTSEQINELAASLALAQGEIEDAIADSTNPHFKSNYADLGSVRAALRKPFSKNGLSIIQLPTMIDSKPALTTRLLHKSGQWTEETCQLLIDKPTMQGLGSALTYMRRYSLSALACLAERDDDGNEAEKHPDKDHMTDAQKKAADEAKTKKLVTDGQIKRLFAICSSRSAMGWNKESMEEVAIATFGLKESLSELNMHQYDKLVEVIETKTYQEAVATVQKWLAEKAAKAAAK